MGMGTDQYSTDPHGYIIRRFVPADPLEEPQLPECLCGAGTWLGPEEPLHLGFPLSCVVT